MSQYAHEVFRWPFAIAGADLSWTVRNTISAADNTQAISAGNYINDGSGTVGALADLIKTLQTAIAAAMVALGPIAGTVTVSMRTDGRVSFAYAGLDKNLALKDLTANQIAYLGVGASQIVGGLFEIGVVGSSGEVVTEFQADCQWHPMMDSNHNSGPVEVENVYAGDNLRGQERRVVRSVAGWYNQIIEWDFVPAAVMSTARAALASYAQVAGITQGENNTWERMRQYLCDVSLDQPYGDNRVYLYEYNDPATAVRSGPWEYKLAESKPSLNGLDPRGYVRGMGSEFYPVSIVLRTQQ